MHCCCNKFWKDSDIDYASYEKFCQILLIIPLGFIVFLNMVQRTNRSVMVRIVHGTNSPGTVRIVHGTNSPGTVRIVQGTNSPRYE